MFELVINQTLMVVIAKSNWIRAGITPMQESQVLNGPANQDRNGKLFSYIHTRICKKFSMVWPTQFQELHIIP
jgi:hypothetical protein